MLLDFVQMSSENATSRAEVVEESGARTRFRQMLLDFGLLRGGLGVDALVGFVLDRVLPAPS